MELKKPICLKEKVVLLRKEIANAGKKENSITIYLREITGKHEFLLQKDVLKLIDKLRDDNMGED